jgi:hypothetical protein
MRSGHFGLTIFAVFIAGTCQAGRASSGSGWFPARGSSIPTPPQTSHSIGDIARVRKHPRPSPRRGNRKGRGRCKGTNLRPVPPPLAHPLHLGSHPVHRPTC